MVRAKWAVLGIVGALALAGSGIVAAGALQGGDASAADRVPA